MAKRKKLFGEADEAEEETQEEVLDVEVADKEEVVVFDDMPAFFVDIEEVPGEVRQKVAKKLDEHGLSDPKRSRVVLKQSLFEALKNALSECDLDREHYSKLFTAYIGAS